jgi:hypothetical protein
MCRPEAWAAGRGSVEPEGHRLRSGLPDLREDGKVPVTTHTTYTFNKIHFHCDVCGDKGTENNKGLGRARYATWLTRHRHPEAEDASR